MKRRPGEKTREIVTETESAPHKKRGEEEKTLYDKVGIFLSLLLLFLYPLFMSKVTYCSRPLVLIFPQFPFSWFFAFEAIKFSAFFAPRMCPCS